MASRMDRYNNTSNVARSVKNKDLYKEIQNTSANNIEIVKTIDKANEIDVNRIKNIINNREKYKKEQKLRQSISGSNINIDLEVKKPDERYDIMDIKPEKLKEDISEVKNYDLVDVLSKAKDDRKDVTSTNRNLKDLEYTELNSLNLHKKEYKDSEAELKDLINEINKTSKINLKDDVGLLDDLKANTMVGDASSIKKILDSERKEAKKDDTKELDKSFFTSVYDFEDADFDEALAKKKSKKKKIIIAIIIFLVVIAVVASLYFLGVFNFKTNS